MAPATREAPIQLAVIGAGRMGAFHLRHLRTSPHLRIVAVSDPSAAARAAATDLVPSAIVFDDAERALDPTSVDACIVATPTPTHPGVVEAAIARGLHVLCEKPLALDPGLGARLGTAADRAGLVLQVGFWRRFSPPWVAAKRAIDAGRVGQPIYLRLSQWDADPPPASFCDPEVSGGLAVDCGVHETDLAEWLSGAQVERVRAWTPPPVDQEIAAVGDTDNLVAVLELSSGAVATVDLSRNARYSDDVRSEVLGSDGALLVEILPSGSTRLGTRAGTEVLDGSRTDDATAAGVVAQAEAFAAAVRGRPVDVPGAEASVRATRIALAMAEAGATGEAVTVR